MKQLIIFTIALASFLSACKQSEKAREVKKYTIKQFMENTDIRGGAFSPDEKYILFTSNKSGVYNAYSMNIETKEIEQLTKSTQSAMYAISYFPDDMRILLAADNEGDEIYHIFMRDTAGNMTDLTPDSVARSTFYSWAHDRNSFFYGSNKRNKRYMDVYEMDIENFEPQLVYQNDSAYRVGAISNDKRYIAFRKTYIRQNSDMFLYDRETKELKLLSEHSGNINFSPIEFNNDGKYLFYLTDKDSEFTYLMKYNLETGETTEVYKDNWDISYAYHSHNERYFVVGINADAQTKIRIFDDKNDGKEVEFPDFKGANVIEVTISRSEENMSFYLSQSNATPDLYVYNFKSGTYKKLTNSMNPEINPNDLVKGEVVRYKSFDGLEIPTILYKPHSATADNKAPAIVWVHGGPGGQSRIGYSALIQYLVNHGYAIIAVNNRGSSGYGKTFSELDDMRHGEDDLQDCIYAKQYLASTGWADTSKTGILGGSYGGYMVVAALAFQPDAFKAGVDIFGVTNWLRTLKNIPPWWEAYRKALYKEMGNPETDSAYLYKISPLFHADKITKPLMVLQGAKDPRVLKVESDEMVEAVKKNGVPVEYVVFEDEGHGFRKTENEIEGYEKILNFLDKYLAEKEEFNKTE
jgi:dipeptidyl aminopeptidase/acylaminoacyl peptidase